MSNEIHTVGDFFGYDFTNLLFSESASDFTNMGPPSHCLPLLPKGAPACLPVPPANASQEPASELIHIGWHIDSHGVVLPLKMGHNIDLMVCSNMMNIYPKQPMTWR